MGGKSSLLEQKFNKKFKNVTVKQDEEGLCVIPDRPPSFSQKLHCQKCPKKLNLSRSITNIWQPICKVFKLLLKSVTFRTFTFILDMRIAVPASTAHGRHDHIWLVHMAAMRISHQVPVLLQWKMLKLSEIRINKSHNR